MGEEGNDWDIGCPLRAFCQNIILGLKNQVHMSHIN